MVFLRYQFLQKTNGYIYVLLMACLINCTVAPVLAGTVSGADGLIIKENNKGHISTEVKIQADISFDILAVINTAGIIQGFFFAFLLVNIKLGNRRAHRILAFLLCILSLTIMYGAYFFTGLFNRHPGLSFIGETVPPFLLVCPLLYLYVVCICFPSFRFKPVHLLNFMPAAIAVVVAVLNRMSMTAEEIKFFWMAYVNDTSYHLSVNDTFLIICLIIYSGVYLVLSLRLLAWHKKRIRELFSSIEDINLSWLNYLVRLILLIYALFALVHVYWFYGGDYGWFITQRIYPVVITIFIFVIGYKGLSQHEIFTGTSGLCDDSTDIPGEKRTLSHAKISDIMTKLTSLMAERQPWLDPDLTLPMLADMLAVPRNYLSQAINEERNQNFFDYINAYRVETAMEFLADPEKQGLNILHLAFAAGFNSKATFNFVFKKHTGLTPTQYKKTVQTR